MTPEDTRRRLTTAGLMEHWETGVPVVIPISGAPALRLRIDPPRSRLTLRAPLNPQVQCPVNTLAFVAVETRFDGGVRYLEISTTDDRLVVDGYAMLMAVADRIQLDGIDPVAAFEQTLATWQSMLAIRLRMNPQAEIGLVGELLVVRALLRTSVASPGAWRSGQSEEHDFGFADADLETKTTSGEQRHHWIHGLSQLVPTGNSPLWLLSIQLTRAGEGEGGRLPDLIDEVLADASPPDRHRIEQNIAAAGWSEQERDLFDDRWRLRSSPLALHVDGEFPRLTPDLLTAAAIDITPLRRVAYEIDLTGRVPSPDPPPTLATIIKHLGDTFDG